MVPDSEVQNGHLDIGTHLADYTITETIGPQHE